MKKRTRTPLAVLRQGDVLLIPTTRTPSTAAQRITEKGTGKTILAYGEATGHSHEVITAAPPVVVGDPDPVPAQQLFEEPDGTRILVLKQPCALTHQEHSRIELPAGSTFIVRRQAEWSLDDVRQVAD